MRDSIIKDSSFLGPYSHSAKLKVGDIQTMSFLPTDPGPFYLKDNEKVSKKYDKVNGFKEVRLKKLELMSKL